MCFSDISDFFQNNNGFYSTADADPGFPCQPLNCVACIPLNLHGNPKRTPLTPLGREGGYYPCVLCIRFRERGLRKPLSIGHMLGATNPCKRILQCPRTNNPKPQKLTAQKPLSCWRQLIYDACAAPSGVLDRCVQP